MKCKIMHESKGRMRVRFCISRMTLKQADTAEYALSAVVGVTRVQVFERTCDIVIAYTCPREKIIGELSAFSFDDEKNTALVPEHTGRKLNKQYEEKLAGGSYKKISEQAHSADAAPQDNGCYKSGKVHISGTEMSFEGHAGGISA